MYKKHLKQLRRDIFDCAFDPDICGFATTNELAEASGLSWTTVDNLYRGITKYPRHATIYSLALAIGMDIQYVKEACHTSS